MKSSRSSHNKKLLIFNQFKLKKSGIKTWFSKLKIKNNPTRYNPQESLLNNNKLKILSKSTPVPNLSSKSHSKGLFKKNISNLRTHPIPWKAKNQSDLKYLFAKNNPNHNFLPPHFWKNKPNRNSIKRKTQDSNLSKKTFQIFWPGPLNLQLSKMSSIDLGSLTSSQILQSIQTNLTFLPLFQKLKTKSINLKLATWNFSNN